MRNLACGCRLLVLGVLALVASPIPHGEDRGVKIGDVKIGIQTESYEKLTLPLSAWVLLAGGCAHLVLGHEKLRGGAIPQARTCRAPIEGPGLESGVPAITQ